MRFEARILRCDGDGDVDLTERYVWDLAAMDGKGNVVLDFVDDDLDGEAEDHELAAHGCHCRVGSGKKEGGLLYLVGGNALLCRTPPFAKEIS